MDLVLNARKRGRPGGRGRGRHEVKALLLPVERERFRELARAHYPSVSRAVTAACMGWCDSVLAFYGERESAEPWTPPKGRVPVSGWLDADQEVRWRLAVERSRLGSSVRAANAACLRWLITRR